jgi:hypothetical protein
MATDSICIVDGCCKTARNSRGWCTMHYTRWRRYGTPDTVKKHRHAATAFLVDVAFNHRGTDCLFWPFATSRGYGWVKYNGKGSVVPRLVCEHVHGPAPTPKHHAAHSCGNGHLGCCSPEHLRWATAQENSADRIAHGTANRGESQWNSKLTAANVSKIKAMRGTKTQKEIASQFGVSREVVSSIFRRKSWAWLD